MNFLFLTPRLSPRSNLGLKFANAFGVNSARQKGFGKCETTGHQVAHQAAAQVEVQRSGKHA